MSSTRRRQLDLIDHDFYLFRERDSDELQVIYHRTARIR